MSSTILVVEDEERIRQFLQRGLGFEGYRIEVAPDGPTALELARDTPPDLVLLDLMLPGMDGLEVCRRLRAVSDVPILMLTAKGKRSMIESPGWTPGADDYLVKPSPSTNSWLVCGRCCAGHNQPSRKYSASPIWNWTPARGRADAAGRLRSDRQGV